MRVEFLMPDVGEGIDGADVLEWQVSAGDVVAEDQPLVEVETDKAVVVIPCPASGTVSELRFEAGSRVEVGEVLAVFEATSAGAPQAGERPASADEQESAAGLPANAMPPESATATQGSRPAAESARVESARAESASAVSPRPLASPATRRLAREHGVDLASVRGSGPHGRIRREDVLAARERATSPREARAQPASSGSVERIVPLSGVRRAIARRLTESWQTIPHVIDYREVDATRLSAVRGALRERAAREGHESLRRALTVTPLLVKIAAQALARHPLVNASIDMEQEVVIYHDRCDIGVATATPEGLMVPVLRDADSKTIADLALELMELTDAARSRTLTPAQLRGATFTVNNFGGLGIWLGTPIINPPEVANLGIGRADLRPVVRDGEVVARSVMTLSVSGDHRLLDGDTLAAFVSDVVELIEEPDLMLAEAK